MGLAASQARLLLLTARRSDLEYRAQIISQRKIMLAMQTEKLATEYTQALSNKILMFAYEQDGNAGTTINTPLTYAQLTTENPDITGRYIVTDAEGKMIVPSTSQLPAGFVLSDDGQKASATINGQTYTYDLNVCEDMGNAYVFQNALRNGGIFLKKFNEDSEEGFESDTWQSDANIQDTLYTADDEIAQSRYEASSLRLQNQDKMLDLELKNIETQHKAIETEVDSVKKVIEKNIEETYKIFA